MNALENLKLVLLFNDSKKNIWVFFLFCFCFSSLVFAGGTNAVKSVNAVDEVNETNKFNINDKKMGPELGFWNKKVRDAFDRRMTPENIAKFEQQKSKNDTNLLSHMFGESPINPQHPTLDGEFIEAEKLAQAITSHCESCTMQTHSGKFGLPEFLITFSNSFWINIGCDPRTVEIQTPVLTYEQYASLESFIQENIYDVARRELALVPKDDTDGHSNLDIASNFDYVQEYAVFLLDQINHPEWALGLLGHDLHNAPPLVLQDQAQLDRFYELIDEVNSGKITSIAKFNDLMNKKVYYKTAGFNSTSTSNLRYQAVSTRDAHRVELRYTATRSSFHLVLLNYEFLLRRIAYLKTQPSKLKVYKKLRVADFKKADGILEPEKISRFSFCIREMGENIEKYLPLIYDSVISNQHTSYPKNYDIFYKGNFFDAHYFKRVEHLRPDYRLRYVEDQIIAYIPDLIDSEWARRQMHLILSDPHVPQSSRYRIISEIDRLILFENKTRSQISEVLEDFKRTLLPRTASNSCNILFN